MKQNHKQSIRVSLLIYSWCHVLFQGIHTQAQEPTQFTTEVFLFFYKLILYWHNKHTLPQLGRSPKTQCDFVETQATKTIWCYLCILSNLMID